MVVCKCGLQEEIEKLTRPWRCRVLRLIARRVRDNWRADIGHHHLCWSEQHVI